MVVDSVKIMTYPTLNFPTFSFSTRMNETKEVEIFDVIRKKYVRLTPEEWVRQHALHFLIHTKHFPLSLIAVEGSVRVGKLNQRFDLLVYNRSLKPSLLVECKAPQVKISQQTFDQIARYSQALQVKNLWVTNGLEHYSFYYNNAKFCYDFRKNIPSFEELNG